MSSIAIAIATAMPCPPHAVRGLPVVRLARQARIEEIQIVVAGSDLAGVALWFSFA
jgi:hypothetical protein